MRILSSALLIAALLPPAAIAQNIDTQTVLDAYEVYFDAFEISGDPTAGGAYCSDDPAAAGPSLSRAVAGKWDMRFVAGTTQTALGVQPIDISQMPTSLPFRIVRHGNAMRLYPAMRRVPYEAEWIDGLDADFSVPDALVGTGLPDNGSIADYLGCPLASAATLSGWYEVRGRVDTTIVVFRDANSALGLSISQKDNATATMLFTLEPYLGKETPTLFDGCEAEHAEGDTAVAETISGDWTGIYGDGTIFSGDDATESPVSQIPSDEREFSVSFNTTDAGTTARMGGADMTAGVFEGGTQGEFGLRGSDGFVRDMDFDTMGFAPDCTSDQLPVIRVDGVVTLNTGETASVVTMLHYVNEDTLAGTMLMNAGQGDSEFHSRRFVTLVR